MHNALWVDDNLDLVIGDAKEPVRLYDFQPLIHQSGRVNRDLWPHPPGGMRQRLGYCDLALLLQRFVSEGAAGGSENQPGNILGRFPAQALPEGAVFAIDW